MDRNDESLLKEHERQYTSGLAISPTSLLSCTVAVLWMTQTWYIDAIASLSKTCVLDVSYHIPAAYQLPTSSALVHDLDWIYGLRHF
jgi:hypothetical protein